MATLEYLLGIISLLFTNSGLIIYLNLRNFDRSGLLSDTLLCQFKQQHRLLSFQSTYLLSGSLQLLLVVLVHLWAQVQVLVLEVLVEVGELGQELVADAAVFFVLSRKTKWQEPLQHQYQPWRQWKALHSFSCQ